MTIDEALKLAKQVSSAGNAGRAEALCRRVLEAAPNHPEAKRILEMLADQSRRQEESVQLMQREIALNPTNAQSHANLGRVLARLGRMEEAVDPLRKAVALRPDDHRSHQNLSVALTRLGRREEGLAACRKALELAPDYPEAHFNLGMSLLQRGEFSAGWEEFEWRLKLPRLHVNRGFSQPQWNGQELSGKTLLLYTDGGFGDALQFSRYIPLLRDRNARLVVECQPALTTLFSQMAGLDRVIPRGTALPDFDLYIPFLSLSRVLGVRLDNIPSSVPYLSAPPQRAAEWAGRIQKDEKLNIGLTWAGSPLSFDARGRSLEVFAPLAQARDVRFHSLQVGEEATQARPVGLEMIDYGADLHDFGETAALVQQLDLVISVDTSVAHLAGALARPVWVLLPFNPDFRWLLGRNDSPWYPTMRLFRQSKIGDWETQVNEMTKRLESFQRR
jgi:Flp pilus assembly protein TadD